MHAGFVYRENSGMQVLWTESVDSNHSDVYPDNHKILDGVLQKTEQRLRCHGDADPKTISQFLEPGKPPTACSETQLCTASQPASQ